MFLLAEVSAAQLSAAVAYVAEASRSWAASTVEAYRRTRGRDIAGRAVERLRALLPAADVQVGRELAGASTKLHRFDVVVSLPDGRLAAFESLLPAQASIAAAHLKFYDLKQAHGDWRCEAVVEELSSWPTSDLAIVQQVASGVRDIEAAWDDLASLAA